MSGAPRKDIPPRGLVGWDDYGNLVVRLDGVNNLITGTIPRRGWRRWIHRRRLR